MKMRSAPPSRSSPILAPGRNCWAVCAADQSGLLIDARAYYKAFRDAAARARRYLLIAGWRFNSDIRLVRGPDAGQGEEDQLVPFLDGLCERKPGLHVYILAWDFSINYAPEWELFQKRKFESSRHKRIHFCFDAAHAIGGSHHQKLVVIDGRIAFVGGLDFSPGSWDDRDHHALNLDRTDSGQEPHDPYHDIQAYVTGAAASELASYFQSRWEAACGGRLDLLPEPTGGPPPFRASVRLGPAEIALSQTWPPTLTRPESVRQIRQLFLDAVASARELIYVENQYLSSEAFYQALRERMQAPNQPRLEIILVLPKRMHGWIEAAAVGGPRVRILDDLRELAQTTGHRLGVYYSAVKTADDRELQVFIHSKVLLVDDRFLTVGSANLSNRSLGLDSELNVAWEARTSADAKLMGAIRRVRVSLLAEHCGLRHSAAARRGLRRTQGLVDWLDRIADEGVSRLHRLTPEVILAEREWLDQLARWGFSLDPERPVIEENLHEAAEAVPTSILGRGLDLVQHWLIRKTRH